jgi:hypothetical protein
LFIQLRILTSHASWFAARSPTDPVRSDKLSPPPAPARNDLSGWPIATQRHLQFADIVVIKAALEHLVKQAPSL